MSSQNYFNTADIRKGINYSVQNSHFLMFVNHLLLRKQRCIVMEGVAIFSLSQGDVGISSPPDSTTNNNNSSTAQENTRNQGRQLGAISTEGSNTFLQAIWFLYKNCGRKMLIYFLQYDLISLFRHL